MYDETLIEIHESLCHLGVTRFYHFVRMKNLPYSINDVRTVVHQCKICSEIKPNFYKPPKAELVKATQPFERISLDFKGALPSSTKNHYMVTVVDEFSRFPFAFPCASIDAKTVIACLNQLFAIFGLPSYVHSNRAATFTSSELSSYFLRRGIACSRTSAYNARGNGQCERYNGIIWTAVRLALKSRKLDTRQWELVLADALHSIRFLLCTATNQTPHERLFNYQRKSSFGTSVPTWLDGQGPVFLKRHVRTSKYDPVVDQANWCMQRQITEWYVFPAAVERPLYRYVTLLRVILLTSHHLFVMTILHPLTFMRTLQ